MAYKGRDSHVAFTINGEMYLWNRGVDRLVRVLQRLETAAIGTKQEMKAHEVWLERFAPG
jgi:hypothetical protein